MWRKKATPLYQRYFQVELNRNNMLPLQLHTQKMKCFILTEQKGWLIWKCWRFTLIRKIYFSFIIQYNILIFKSRLPQKSQLLLWPLKFLPFLRQTPILVCLYVFFCIRKQVRHYVLCLDDILYVLTKSILIKFFWSLKIYFCVRNLNLIRLQMSWVK